VIVRVNKETDEAEVLNSDQELSAGPLAENFADNGQNWRLIGKNHKMDEDTQYEDGNWYYLRDQKNSDLDWETAAHRPIHHRRWRRHWNYHLPRWYRRYHWYRYVPSYYYRNSFYFYQPYYYYMRGLYSYYYYRYWY